MRRYISARCAGGGQQGGDSPVAYRHVVEEPDEQRPRVDDLVEIRLARDVLPVGAGVAGREAEGQPVALEQGHGVLHLPVDARAAAAVVGLLEALEADGRDEVLHPQHFLAERLVDQGAVGEGEELAVGVLLAQGDDVLFADERLAAGEDVHIGAQALALRHDGVQLLQRQVEAVAVLGGPAAGAVHVAGRGGVQQDGPGHVAALAGGRLILGGAAEQAGVQDEILEEGLAHPGVQLVQLEDELVPVALFLDGAADSGALAGVPAGGHQLVHHVHQLGDVGLGVLFQVAHRLAEHKAEGGVLGFIGDIHNVKPRFYTDLAAPRGRCACGLCSV